MILMLMKSFTFYHKLKISERLRQEKLAKARAARSSAPPVTKADIAPRPPSEAKSIDEEPHIPEVSLVTLLHCFTHHLK